MNKHTLLVKRNQLITVIEKDELTKERCCTKVLRFYEYNNRTRTLSLGCSLTNLLMSALLHSDKNQVEKRAE